MLSRQLLSWSIIAHSRPSVYCSHHSLRNLRSRLSSSPLQQARAVTAQAPRADSMDRCTDEQLVALVKDHDCFVFDLDGTIWKGSTVLTGVREALEWLRSLGKDVLFVTNNSMKSRSSYAVKCEQLNIRARQEEIYCSSYSAAAYLRHEGFKGKAYVVGEQGILEELQEAGIPCFGGPADNDKRVPFTDGTTLDFDPEVGAVVCGVDPGLCYYKIAYASLCLLNNPGCLFIATNADSRGHFTADQEWPGAGATVGAIKAVVEREPVLTGKPSPFLIQDIVSTHGVTPQRMLMVGDRLDTDIAWGAATGMSTLLVMTGVTDEAMLSRAVADGPVRPHHVLDSFADILRVKGHPALAASTGS